VLVQGSDRPRTVEELLGRDLAARLDRLDVLSRKVFAGKLPGERRSKKKGQSVEFDDYRDYVPGDDLRHLDWTVFARHDRFVVKLFREEEDLALHVVLDMSPSMDTGRPNKLVFAARMAMALGYIGLVNQNRVSLTTFGGVERGFTQIKAMRGRRNVERYARGLLDRLNERPAPGSFDPGGERTTFNAAAKRLASTRVGAGVMVILSDFLDREGYEEGLNYLGVGHGFDTYCLQVLSPEELDPSRASDEGLVGDLRLTDVETGHGAEVTITGATLKRYRERLERYLAGVREACSRRGMTHLVVPSETDVGEYLLGSLRRRGLVG